VNNFFLDTCSLKWRYLAGNPTRHVISIVESAGNSAYIGELTILEWSSALAVAVMEGAISREVFKSNELALFSDIAERRLRVFRTRRVLERARSWIEYIGVVNRRHLRTNDAIHLSTAIELSSQLREEVTFITSDMKLHKTIESFDVLKPNLTSHYLAP
jgi:predicted nucleic acid-binding protein